VLGVGGTDVLGNATSMEGGQNHSLAIKDGMVYAWGHNGSGQLGMTPLVAAPTAARRCR
jgi:alpha-tubulin suppressor-like RCC1 family protein